MNDVAHVATALNDGLIDLGFPSGVFRPTIGTYRSSGLRRASLLLRRPAESLAVRRSFIAGRYSFLHVHFASFALMAAPAFAPVVIHCHGSDLVGGSVFHRALARASLPFARGVLYSTPNLAATLKRWRPDATFLPNPVRDLAFGAIDDPITRDVFVASKLDNSKGIDVAIEALARVRRSMPRLRIAMLSFGNHAAQLRTLAVQRLGTGIEWLPPLTSDEMIATMRRSHVVLGQLATGAMGVTELEAMATERPLVCYWKYDDAYAVKAPLLSAGDIVGVAEHLRSVLEDRSLANRLGDAARAWCAAEHGVTSVARRLISQYEAWDLA